MFRLVTICTAVFLLNATADAGKHYALVVGVKSYRPNQPLPTLSYTEQDADDLAAVLNAGGYQVTLMTQTASRIRKKNALNPDSTYIRDQLDSLLDNPYLKDDDIVVIALAGHGVQFERQNKDGMKDSQFYFCPGDADIKGMKTADKITEKNRLINLDEIYTRLKNCKAGAKLLLVDACRNDPTKPGITRGLASKTLPALAPPPGGTAAFFSCSENQKAFEDAELEHGVFFHHVIQGLKGDADSATRKQAADGRITLFELSQHVSSETYDYVRTKFDAMQAPELKGRFRLDVPLIGVAQSTKLITNTVGMRFALVPAGNLPKEADRRGHPLRQSILIRPFYLGESEVTQEHFATVMKTNPSAFCSTGLRHDRVLGVDTKTLPVETVSFREAREFCSRLTAVEQAAGHRRLYRLPKEMEWEYAGRAGNSGRFSFGEDSSKLGDAAWFRQNSGTGNLRRPQKVGTRQPNSWGIFDIHGNVAEWCVAEDRNGVIRGGSWMDGPEFCELQFRDVPGDSIQQSDIGFRVLLEVAP